MRILLDPGTYDCRNMGDVAMLQVAVDRLRSVWPDAALHVLTNEPGALARYCPGVIAASDAGRRTWFADRQLLGGVHRALPAPASAALVRTRHLVRRRTPALLKTLIQLRARLRPAERAEFATFMTALEHADLHVVSGQGGLSDTGIKHAEIVLRTLELACRRGTPAVMLGQGVGPMTEPRLLTVASEILPRARFIAVREGRVAPSLLQSVGVAADRIVVTGDDAVELAYALRRSEYGLGIGVNLRVASNAGVDDDIVAALRPVLHDFARHHETTLVPLPIAHHSAAADVQVIRRLLAGFDDAGSGGAELDSPQKVIEQAGRCRVVVTGAYHAAVFALAQGIPAVCLSGSAYYADKFRGLRDLFGEGCRIVWLDRPSAAADLAANLDAAWQHAGSLRLPLLRAAERQVAWGRAALARVAAIGAGAAAPAVRTGASSRAGRP